MSRFQAGALVVYGNLGVHEVEGIGLRHFCDEPAREYYTLRPYFSDSHDRSYIPTAKEGVLRPVTPAQQAAADLARIKAETLPIPTGIQTALAEHYQALLHTNDFYQYLTLFKELGQKQNQQQSRGRKINAMDTYFYQMVERVLREELAVAFGESQQEAGRRLLEILNVIGAASLCAGIDFVRRQTVSGLYRHESHLCQLLCDALAEIPEITVYRQPDVAYVPIVSFTVAGASPEETADYLNRQGFCLRAGLHCAPLAHEKLGTKDGTVRFAPSVFSRASDTLRLAANLKNYVNILKSPENLLKNSGDMLQ